MNYTVIPRQKGEFVLLVCTGDMTLGEIAIAWGETQLVLAGDGMESNPG